MRIGLEKAMGTGRVLEYKKLFFQDLVPVPLLRLGELRKQLRRFYERYTCTTNYSTVDLKVYGVQ